MLGEMLNEVPRTRPLDLLVWSTIACDETLVRIFWLKCKKPVHMALIASSISGKLARQLTGSGHEYEYQKLEERLEQLALGVLSEAQDQETAFQILRESGTDGSRVVGNKNVLDLAGTLGRKNFVNQSHCQAIMDRWWRCASQALPSFPKQPQHTARASPCAIHSPRPVPIRVLLSECSWPSAPIQVLLSECCLQLWPHRGKNYMLPDRGTYDLAPNFKYGETMLYALFPFLNIRLFAPLWRTAEDKSTAPKLNSQIWSIMAKGNAIRRYQRARAQEKAEQRPLDKTPEIEGPTKAKPKEGRISTISGLLAAAKLQGLTAPQQLKPKMDQEVALSRVGEIVSLFTSFYKIPAVKFVDRMAVRMIFLVIYAVRAARPFPL